jgi:[protein-PII] uridylyltransferase
MQEYYRTAKTVTQINAILLQNIGAALFPPPDEPPQPINERFQNDARVSRRGRRGRLHRNTGSHSRDLLLLQNGLEREGDDARAQRALWRARKLIDDDFRRSPVNRARFLAIFKQERRLVQVFRRMNQSGVLGRYLPAFGRIVGQMQHDLFHVYTVDQHILQVMRNLRRFTMEEFAHEYPFCSRLISDLGDPWILYIAALFHDIAKGRGGDHSELGAVDARDSVRSMILAAEDSELIVWLVRQHLLMSRVAQKQDLSDPAVVVPFARIVGDERHLIALYLLTVADIRGTSPKVWNTWKAQLLEQLFTATRRCLLSREATADDRRRHCPATAGSAAPDALFRASRTAHEALWEQLDTVYFLRQSAEEIAWHARALHDRDHDAIDQPVVRARLNPLGEGLEVMVYTHATSGPLPAHGRLFQPRRLQHRRRQDPHHACTATRSTPSCCLTSAAATVTVR